MFPISRLSRKEPDARQTNQAVTQSVRGAPGTGNDPGLKHKLRAGSYCLYPHQYNHCMKAVVFLGDSLKCLRDFPEDARHDAGYQIDKVQRGEQPDDFKPMPSIGKGVEDIRIGDDSGAYRVIYTARLADAVYVLHACVPEENAGDEQARH